MKTNYTNLKSCLLTHLLQQDCYSKQRIERKISSQPMMLAAMQYRGYIFISDTRHTIQMVLPENNLQEKTLTIATDPLNILETAYYQKLNKLRYDFWEPYNTTDEQLLKETEYPHPYCPQFFMHEFFDDFVINRGQMQQIKVSSRIVRITKWRVRIVNVSNSGWYAPVIEPLAHKYDTSPLDTFKQLYTTSSSILYESEIRDIMEALRLADMRQANRNARAKMLPFSLAFYLYGSGGKIKPKSIMCDVDHSSEYLSFSKDRKISYIPFGPLSGTMTLTSIVDRPTLNTEMIHQRHIKQLEQTFKKGSSQVKTAKAAKTAEQQMIEDWDKESYEMSDEQVQDVRENPKQMIDEADEESEDEQDILQGLYKAQINFSSLKLI